MKTNKKAFKNWLIDLWEDTEIDLMIEWKRLTHQEKIKVVNLIMSFDQTRWYQDFLQWQDSEIINHQEMKKQRQKKEAK